LQTLALCLTTIGCAGQFSNEGIVLLGIIQDGIFTVFSYRDVRHCPICIQFFLMDYLGWGRGVVYLLNFERGLVKISMEKWADFPNFGAPLHTLKIPHRSQNRVDF
jgi:hypothetical protein